MKPKRKPVIHLRCQSMSMPMLCRSWSECGAFLLHGHIADDHRKVTCRSCMRTKEYRRLAGEE